MGWPRPWGVPLGKNTIPWLEMAAPYPRFKMLTTPPLCLQAKAMPTANPAADNFVRLQY